MGFRCRSGFGSATLWGTVLLGCFVGRVGASTWNEGPQDHLSMSLGHPSHSVSGRMLPRRGEPAGSTMISMDDLPDGQLLEV